MPVMKKMILILAVAFVLSGCSSQGMQGNPAAIMVGANVGGLVGGIVGDGMDGYRGSLFGSLIGTVSGALIANAATTPRQDDGYYIEETYGYVPEPERNRQPESYRPRAARSSDLVVKHIRFVDANRNQVIDSNETAKIIFEVMNTGRTDIYNVTPVIKELNGVKQLYISPSATIECIPAGDGIRYTANIRTGKKLKTGEALFQITVLEGNGASVSSRTFAIPTQRR